MTSSYRLNQLIHDIYPALGWQVTTIMCENESQDYVAYRFSLNGKNIVFRKGKITPLKIGFFVTLWKRKEEKTAPLDKEDDFDFVIIDTQDDLISGQFIFPKEILLKQEIISNENKRGKTGFRLYPPSLKVASRQAILTQKWQAPYFFETKESPSSDILKFFETDSFFLKQNQ